MPDSNVITVEHLPRSIQRNVFSVNMTIPKTNAELKKIKVKLRAKAVEDMERAFLIDALNRNDWNVTKAAQNVGMKRQNFHALMKKYNVKH